MASGVAGELLVRITPDTRNFASQVERDTSQVGESTGKSMGVKIAGGLAAAFAAAQVGKFIGSSIASASDLAETTSKVEQVFGGAAGSIKDFASSAATDLGQSKQQALDGAAGFATYGKAAGLSGDDLASFSTELVTTASDMASFHNADPSDVIEALGSGLRGEAEPLRKFGIMLNDAAIQEGALAYEMANGIKLERDKKGNLTATSKVLASRQAIMDQVGDAEGDFARTSEGLANQQRIMAAELEDGKAALGEAFLPAVLAVIGVVRPLAQVVLPLLVGAFEAVGGIALWAVETFMKFKTPIAIIAGVILTVMLPALVAWGVQAAVSAAAQVAAFLSTIGSALAAGATMVATGIVIVASWVASAAAAMVNAVIMAAAWLIALGPVAWIIAAVLAVVAIFVVLWKKMDGFKEFWIGLWEVVWNALKAAVDWIVGAVQWLWDMFKKYLNLIWTVWSTIFTTVWDFIKGIWDKVTGWIKAGVDLIVGWVQSIWGFVKSTFDSIWNTIKAVWDTVTGWIDTGIQKIVGWIQGIWGFVVSTFNSIKTTITGVWDTIVSALSTAITGIIDFFTGLPGDIVSAIGNLGQTLFQKGKDLVQGLLDGIKSLGSSIGNFFLDLLPGWIKTPFKKALGIGSPSKVFAEYGVNVVEGLLGGVEGEKSAVTAGMTDLAGAMVDGIEAGSDEVNAALADMTSGATATVDVTPRLADTGDIGTAAARDREAPLVQVFIGDEQLDDFIVKVGRREAEQTANRLLAGVGGGYR